MSGKVFAEAYFSAILPTIKGKKYQEADAQGVRVFLSPKTHFW
jgi:hypothetical protein